MTEPTKGEWFLGPAGGDSPFAMPDHDHNRPAVPELRFQTDAWGGESGVFHYEFDIAGRTATVTISAQNIKIFAPGGLLVDQSLNAADIVFVSIEEASQEWGKRSTWRRTYPRKEGENDAT